MHGRKKTRIRAILRISLNAFIPAVPLLSDRNVILILNPLFVNENSLSLYFDTAMLAIGVLIKSLMSAHSCWFTKKQYICQDG